VRHRERRKMRRGRRRGRRRIKLNGVKTDFKKTTYYIFIKFVKNTPAKFWQKYCQGKKYVIYEGCTELYPYGAPKLPKNWAYNMYLNRHSLHYKCTNIVTK